VVGGRNGGGVANGRQFLSSGSSSAGDRRKCCSRTNLWSKPGEGIPVGEFGQRIVVPEYDEDEDVDGEGEIKLECDESGCVIVMEKFKTLAEEAGGDGYLRCDLTGCYFADEPAPVKSFEVIEGEGWRLGYETAPESEESFCAIIGAGGWSVALTASEFNDFCNLIQTLRKGISTMDEDGVIGKDEVVMQVERGSVWMECNIPKKQVAIFQNLWKRGSRALIDSQQKTAFELRFILSGASGRRQAEGFWPPEAVMDMLKKVDAATLELQYKAQKAAAASA